MSKTLKLIGSTLVLATLSACAVVPGPVVYSEPRYEVRTIRPQPYYYPQPMPYVVVPERGRRPAHRHHGW